MKKPIIGISTSFATKINQMNSVRLSQAYVNAITDAGGIPVLLPSSIDPADLPVLAEKLDGLLLSGGGDISIKFFNGQDHPAISGVDLNRDNLELAITKLFKHSGKPILGICRGVQALNVALGGTLNTHLPEQVNTKINHSNDAPDGIETRQQIVHTVTVDENSKLRSIVGQSILEVNSFHHQGVRDLAPGAVVTSHAPDGTVESIEFPEHPFCLGVQWHPEWLTFQPETQKLFKAFVEASIK